MASFVRYTLEDGWKFCSSRRKAVWLSRAAGAPEVADGGRLQTPAGARVLGRVPPVADALRRGCGPDEVELKFGLKVSGEVRWWFFAKNQAEGAIEVTLPAGGGQHGRWRGPDLETVNCRRVYRRSGLATVACLREPGP